MQRGSVPARSGGISLRILMLTALAMLCFAANSLLCRLALAPGLVDAATFTTLRVLSAAGILCLVLWLQRRRFPRLDRANPFSIACLFAYFIGFSFAYLRLDAGSGALILIGAVQLTMFGVAFWEGERFLAAQWLGLAMALFGFVCLVLPGANAPDPLGAVLMGLSGFAWGCFSLLARGSAEPVETNAANLMGCLLLAAVASLFAVRDFEVTPTGVLVAIVSGSIATGLGYVVWYLALRGLPATHAATVQLSMPALVALGGVALLSEPITLRVLVASVAMLGGIGLVLQCAQGPARR
jgi:drug/metabolite transporter (DMT)-like permease